MSRIGGADRRAVEREILAIVGRLVAELGSLPFRGAVALDNSLDRDLGLGSLERVELLLRLEQAFGVRLPDAVMAGAESPGDLAGAILAARPAPPEPVPEARPPMGAGIAAPASAGTLAEVLGWHAEAEPERVHVFLRDEDGREQPITYKALWDHSVALAAGLSDRGLRPGESVALMLRTEEAFFHAFFGTLVAGGVPVPIYPPFRPDRIEEYARRQVGILRNAEARMLITFRQAERVAGRLRSRVPSLREVVAADRLAASPAGAPPFHGRPADPALIQYTSGSTGDPKGVLLSHANILAKLFSSQITPFLTSLTTGFTRASATYFIPAASPDSPLVSAKLRVGLFVLGHPSAVRISGKSPLGLDNVSCRGFVPGVEVCTAFGTWDFTEEAAALAAQGGGELSLTADPIPPALVQSFPPPFSLENRQGFWISQLDVNYPWSHGGESGALALSFQQACPKDLAVKVTPSGVLPRIPDGNPIPVDLAIEPLSATVEAVVKSCPPDGGAPASVDVTLEVLAPSPGSDGAGGHSHDTQRPTGTFERPFFQLGISTARCPAVVLDAQGIGVCRVTYFPHEVSGTETIRARAAGFPDGQAEVTVRVPGLMNLAEIRTNFWRLTGRTTQHPDNHWGTAETVNNVQLIALDFFELLNATLGMNDMSLPRGGLFDITGGWAVPHNWHRTGTSVDIDRLACVGLVPDDSNPFPPCPTRFINVPRDFIRLRCERRGQGFLVREPTIHCEFPR